MYTQEEIDKAKKRVNAKKKFYQHLMSFALVNTFLFILNIITSPTQWWFVYPLLGWGLGLGFHYVEVFGIPGFDILSKEWEERALDRELSRMDQEKPRKMTTRADNGNLKPEDENFQLKELRKDYDESEFV